MITRAPTLQTPPHNNTPHKSKPRHAARSETLGTVLLTIAMIAIQAVMVSAYAWSAASTAPRDLPIAVAGPAKAVAAVTAELDHAHPGAFRVVPASTQAQAKRDIDTRVAYGAIVLDATTPKVLIASAASPAAASVLTTLADHLDGIQQPDISNVVPGSAVDPTGAGFGFTVLPLMITSLMGGIMLGLRIRRVSHRIPALLIYAAGGGAATIAIAHTWLGIIPGNFVVLAAATGLAVLAVAAAVSGLAHVASHFGKTMVGVVIGGVVIMMVGNPFSGMSSAPQMLPRIWGTIGTYLPTGAVATLLRSVAYFGGAGSAVPWTVLSVWAAGGILLTLTRRRAATASAAPGPEPRPGLTPA